jgi:hypothetical protein
VALSDQWVDLTDVSILMHGKDLTILLLHMENSVE